MSKKNQYVPPAAELIFLMPCEELAIEEWKFGFGHTWKNNAYLPGNGGASGIAISGSLVDDDFLKDSNDGFNIVAKK